MLSIYQSMDNQLLEQMAIFDDMPEEIRMLVHRYGFARVYGLYLEGLPEWEIRQVLDAR